MSSSSELSEGEDYWKVKTTIILPSGKNLTLRIKITSQGYWPLYFSKLQRKLIHGIGYEQYEQDEISGFTFKDEAINSDNISRIFPRGSSPTIKPVFTTTDTVVGLMVSAHNSTVRWRDSFTLFFAVDASIIALFTDACASLDVRRELITVPVPMRGGRGMVEKWPGWGIDPTSVWKTPTSDTELQKKFSLCGYLLHVCSLDSRSGFDTNKPGVHIQFKLTKMVSEEEKLAQ